MSNPNPKDDLDFGLSPSAPSNSQSKKKGARSRKVLLLAALVIAEGAIIGAMALLWPRPAGPTDRTINTEVSIWNYVRSDVPNNNYQSNLCVEQEGGQYQCLTYLSWPLHQRPAGYTSVGIVFSTTSNNFTWWNVSLVPGLWDMSTVTWNTRPATGESVANMSVPLRLDVLDRFITRINVTERVRTGTNFSLCFAPLLNDTFAGKILVEANIIWTYRVSTAGVHATVIPWWFMLTALLAIGKPTAWRKKTSRTPNEEGDLS